MNPTAEKLLDAAEQRMRAGGYNAVSFRDLAQDTGIKSASVHYHFATKETLGVAVVERYHSTFFETLSARADDADTHRDKLVLFVDQYRNALRINHSICLCAMLGAEGTGLPAPVVEKVEAFFKAAEDWLIPVFAAHTQNPQQLATLTVSALSGALVVAATTKDADRFEKTAAFIQKLV